MAANSSLLNANIVLASDSSMCGAQTMSDDFTTNTLKAESRFVRKLLSDIADTDNINDISKCVSGATGDVSGKSVEAGQETLLMYRVPLQTQIGLANSPHLRGYLLLLAPGATTPNFFFDRDAILTSVQEEINFKSVAERVEHWNEVTETFGLENSERAEKNPPARVFNSLVVASRLTMLPGKEVRLPAHSCINLRNAEKSFAVALLVTEANARITTLATPSGAPSSLAAHPAPPSACAKMIYSRVVQGSADHKTVIGILEKLKAQTRGCAEEVESLSNNNEKSFAELEEQIENTKRSLGDDINKRFPRALNPMDHWKLRLIGEDLVRFISAGGKLSRDLTVEHLWNSFTNEPGEKLMMTRVHYVPKDNKNLPFVLRIHLFPNNPSENVPHNHHSNCCSMVLTGSYLHKTFRVVQDLPGMKVRVMLSRKYKENSLGDLERTQGSLKLLTRNEHSYPNVYFLAQDTYHVVAQEAPEPGCSLQQVVSLFLKDKTSGETKFLVEENDDRKLPCASRVEVLNGDEKDHVLRRIEELLRSC